MDEQKLIIFLKAPRPGTVKTRLAQTMGDAGACAAYSALVTRVTKNLAGLESVELRFAPDDAEVEIKSWAQPQWSMKPQRQGDLGQRLMAAFQESFADGIKRVVIIGADCPAVMPGDIVSAWAALQMNDLVLGPATDGGYWLIGLRAPQPSLFEGISWSTDRVLQQTLDRAKAAGLCVHLLRELTDVDTEVQWREFLTQSSSPGTAGIPAGVWAPE